MKLNNIVIVILACSLFTTSILPISIENDLLSLIEADPQYGGFQNAKVYIQGELVPFNHTITIPHNDDYEIEIVIPADYAATLAGKDFSNFFKKILKYVRCYLHIRYKPESKKDTHYLTDILIEKTTNAHYTVYPRGVFGITVYVDR